MCSPCSDSAATLTQVGLCISPCKGQILQRVFFKGPFFGPISHFLTLGDYLAFRVGVWVVTTLKSKARWNSSKTSGADKATEQLQVCTDYSAQTRSTLLIPRNSVISLSQASNPLATFSAHLINRTGFWKYHLRKTNVNDRIRALSFLPRKQKTNIVNYPSITQKQMLEVLFPVAIIEAVPCNKRLLRQYLMALFIILSKLHLKFKPTRLFECKSQCSRVF